MREMRLKTELALIYENTLPNVSFKIFGNYLVGNFGVRER